MKLVDKLDSLLNIRNNYNLYNLVILVVKPESILLSQNCRHRQHACVSVGIP